MGGKRKDSVVSSSSSSEWPNFQAIQRQGSLLAKGEGNYFVRKVSIPEDKDLKEVETRETWAHSLDFILSAMGYSVGLGNVWRFPYKMHQNGQGAFLIPYFIMLLVLGVPLVFLEFVLGQYSAKGPGKVFGRLSPLFKGLGLSMLAMTSLNAIYYNMVLAWTLIYMFAGFQPNLPWACENGTYAMNEARIFFEQEVVGITEDVTWSNYGTPQWKLVLSLFGAWSIVCICSVWGMKVLGKIIYFTVLYPMFVFIILTIVGLSTFEDSGRGLREFMTPNMTMLGDFKVRDNINKKRFLKIQSSYIFKRYGRKQPHKCSTL